MRVAIGGVLHETSTFLPFPTKLADFENGFGLYRRSQIETRFRNANMCIGGFLDAADQNGFEAVPLLWAFAYPSGVIQRTAYDQLKNEFMAMLAEADRQSPLDGVLLDLHGAMVVEGAEDGDGDFVESVRAAIGPNRPIIVNYDLHGNHTAARMNAANASIGYDTYPHVDMAERGREAGRMIAQTIRGEVKPMTSFVSVPCFWSAQQQVTSQPPMSEVLERLYEIERRPGILSASVATGFPWADVPNLGASVFVVSDGDRTLGERTANELAQWIWERRADWFRAPPSLDDALAAGRAAGRFPVMFGDYNDNTGGGAPGDSTGALQWLIDNDLRDSLVLYIADPEAALLAHQAGAGARIAIAVGGKSHPAQGQPVQMDAEVVAISNGEFRYDGPMYAGLTGNMGPSAWLRKDGVNVVVVSKREQPLDPAFARSLGIDCASMKYIVVKSAVHFRSGFQAFAGSIHLVDVLALHSHRFESLDYRRRQPLYPIDRQS